MKKNATSSEILLLALLVNLFFAISTTSAQTIASVGVGEFELDVDSEQLGSRSATDVLETLSGNLDNTLAGTRKFRVFDTNALNQELAKHNLNAQGYYDGSYRGEKYDLSGLDYIVTGTITELGLFDRNSDSSDQKVALVDIDFRLIGTSFNTEGFSDSTSVQLNVDSDSGQSEIATMNKAIQLASNEITKKVMGQLFPIRVMRISEQGEVILNYGQGFLSAGDTVQVYSGNSSASNGASEPGPASGNVVATLQIISSGAKFSSAQVLDGSDKIANGMKAVAL